MGGLVGSWGVRKAFQVCRAQGPLLESPAFLQLGVEAPQGAQAKKERNQSSTDPVLQPCQCTPKPMLGQGRSGLCKESGQGLLSAAWDSMAETQANPEVTGEFVSAWAYPGMRRQQAMGAQASQRSSSTALPSPHSEP